MSTDDRSTIEHRIAIVGCRNVGATSAYALIIARRANCAARLDDAAGSV